MYKPSIQIYPYPIGSMYAIYSNIYHQYTPNVRIYTIHPTARLAVTRPWPRWGRCDPLRLRLERSEVTNHWGSSGI